MSQELAPPPAPEELLFRNHGKGLITPFSTAANYPRLRVSAFALHLKEDGAVDDGPSICFECRDGDGFVVFHELSVNTLATALEKAGFRITREVIK